MNTVQPSIFQKHGFDNVLGQTELIPDDLETVFYQFFFPFRKMFIINTVDYFSKKKRQHWILVQPEYIIMTSCRFEIQHRRNLVCKNGVARSFGLVDSFEKDPAYCFMRK